MLIYGEPFFMFRIGNRRSRLRFSGCGHGGGRWFRDGPIDIAPEFLTMKIWFDLTKPSEVVGFCKLGELGSVLRSSDVGSCGSHGIFEKEEVGKVKGRDTGRRKRRRDSIRTFWGHRNSTKSSLRRNGLASWIQCNASHNSMGNLSYSWQV